MMNESIVIGKVIEISNISISVSIGSRFSNPYKIINGRPIRIGGVGNFVKVGNDVYEIINEKIVIENQTRDKNNKISSDKLLICNLIGFFRDDKFFQGNSGNTPNIFENIYTVISDELIAIYAGVYTKNTVSVGQYIYQNHLDFKLDINKFFASHILIVGNTGSGKSNTLNTIYSQLFATVDTKNSYFLIIDTNGEYANAFVPSKLVKHLNTYEYSQNELHIPINLLEAEDWKLLLEATDKTQFPIIKKTWNAVCKKIFNNKKRNISEFILEKLKECVKGILTSNASASNKITAINGIRDDLHYMTTPFYNNLETLLENFADVSVNSTRLIRAHKVFDDITPELIEDVNDYEVTEDLLTFSVYDYSFILNLEHLYRTYKYNTNENNTSPMIVRFNSNKSELNAIFTPYEVGDDTDIFDCLFDENKITVCDVSHSKKDIRRIIVTFICSKLYLSLNKRLTKAHSLHLIVDEAHNYLSQQNMNSEDAIAKTCIDTFESIIKEGRKFGTFLTMATQRPSDITSTLLSQAHNYVIHKLVNPKDIDIIKNTVPFIDATSMKMLSILAPGQAIFSGTAFNRPNIIQVDINSNQTEVLSDTLILMKKWKLKQPMKKSKIKRKPPK